MTAEEYIESLRRLGPRPIYLFGERVENPVDHPFIRPSVNACAMTYRLAEIPEYQDLTTATSALTGRRINRFVHLHQSTEDLIKKVKMPRRLGQLTGTCFQRCVGLDALNAVWSTTYEIDQKYGTPYHERFRRFVLEWEEKDWTVDGAMTDPKGNRSLGPSTQADPDLYVHVVERRADGIVVRGAKVHQTGLLNSHQILVMPTLALRPEDADYAVCFAVPADDPTLIYIYGRQSSDTRRLERSPVDMGNIHYGGQEGVIIFNDTFVPWERVFMGGETEFAGMLVERFAAYHRQSYGGCKVGNGDVLIGAAAAVAEYQGVANASHIREKLTEMVHRLEGYKGILVDGTEYEGYMHYRHFLNRGFRVIQENGGKLMYYPLSQLSVTVRPIVAHIPQEAGAEVEVLVIGSLFCPVGVSAVLSIRKVAWEFGERVRVREIPASRDVIAQYGIADGIFINGKPKFFGPVKEEQVRQAIEEELTGQ